MIPLMIGSTETRSPKIRMIRAGTLKRGQTFVKQKAEQYGIRERWGDATIPAIAVVFVWLLTGTAFYHFKDDFRWSMAFYYAVQAGLSIGFGALPEHNISSQLFTIFFLLAGSSLAAGALSLFTQMAVQRHETFIQDIKTPEGAQLARKTFVKETPESPCR